MWFWITFGCIMLVFGAVMAPAFTAGVDLYAVWRRPWDDGHVVATCLILYSAGIFTLLIATVLTMAVCARPALNWCLRFLICFFNVTVRKPARRSAPTRWHPLPHNTPRHASVTCLFHASPGHSEGPAFLPSLSPAVPLHLRLRPLLVHCPTIRGGHRPLPLHTQRHQRRHRLPLPQVLRIRRRLQAAGRHCACHETLQTRAPCAPLSPAMCASCRASLGPLHEAIKRLFASHPRRTSTRTPSA